MLSFDSRRDTNKGLLALDSEQRMNSPDELTGAELINLQHSNQPASGFKKVDLPKLRDRDRALMQFKIGSQNSIVNKTYRRYIN